MRPNRRVLLAVLEGLPPAASPRDERLRSVLAAAEAELAAGRSPGEAEALALQAVYGTA